MATAFEGILFRVHSRTTRMCAKVLSPSLRTVMEYLLLGAALLSAAVCTLLHKEHVWTGHGTPCAAALLRASMSSSPPASTATSAPVIFRFVVQPVSIFSADAMAEPLDGLLTHGGAGPGKATSVLQAELESMLLRWVSEALFDHCTAGRGGSAHGDRSAASSSEVLQSLGIVLDGRMCSEAAPGADSAAAAGAAAAKYLSDAAAAAAAVSSRNASHRWVALSLARSILAGVTPSEASRLVGAACRDSERGDARSVTDESCHASHSSPAGAAALHAAVRASAADAVYLISLDRGLLTLSPALLDSLGVGVVTVTMGADSPCVGYAPTRWLLKQGLGYDVLVINAVLAASEGRGYVLAQDRGEVFALSHATEVARFSQGIVALLLFKLGTACGAVFLLFTSSSLVSFILGHTQQRMLQFTLALHHHVRLRLPLLPLVVSHLLGSLVFVPIMLGVLFFLFEFFSSQLLAFLVLFVVWVCEIWSIISCRTLGSLIVFPRVFGVAMTVFHIYYLTYPFGYEYLCLLAVCNSLLTCMFFLWNRYELPALLCGEVCALEPRAPEVAYVIDGRVRVRATPAGTPQRPARGRPSPAGSDDDDNSGQQQRQPVAAASLEGRTTAAGNRRRDDGGPLPGTGYAPAAPFSAAGFVEPLPSPNRRARASRAGEGSADLSSASAHVRDDSIPPRPDAFTTATAASLMRVRQFFAGTAAGPASTPGAGGGGTSPTPLGVAPSSSPQQQQPQSPPRQQQGSGGWGAWGRRVVSPARAQLLRTCSEGVPPSRGHEVPGPSDPAAAAHPNSITASPGRALAQSAASSAEAAVSVVAGSIGRLSDRIRRRIPLFSDSDEEEEEEPGDEGGRDGCGGGGRSSAALPVAGSGLEESAIALPAAAAASGAGGGAVGAGGVRRRVASSRAFR